MASLCDISLAERLLADARRHPRRMLAQAWGEFVGQWMWEWFGTLTFTEDTHQERALKLFRIWCSKLSREIYGPRWHKRPPYGVIWVLSVEYQKSGRIHLHFVMASVGDTRRLSWMDHWQELDGVAGFPRIFPVENTEAVSNYVTKYVTKEGDVFFSKNLELPSRDLFAG